MNSLGFDKPQSETRVAVAMSGGVDSSTVAALLAGQGYEVVGLTMRLYDQGENVGNGPPSPGTCCAGEDIHDAIRVAGMIGITHYVIDFEDRFLSEVIDDFADSYLMGETPNPCIRCNQTVKFTDLAAKARGLGADALATGHYARRTVGPDGPELHRAADQAKDQSYFLFATTPRQLEFLRFPLGSMDKEETRELARRFSLAVAAKPESQDICFVPEGRYSDFVAAHRPGAFRPGDIVGQDGEVLGPHDGIAGFTVGQRRGLGLSSAEPLYVIRLEPETNRVVAGPREALLRDGLIVHSVNWLGGGPGPQEGMAVSARLRSAGPLVRASLHGLG
ncbi:MAG: tRNA 2-thiouridine(34) synthase MnmA, partial [Rhodospirillales bacterium]